MDVTSQRRYSRVCVAMVAVAGRCGRYSGVAPAGCNDMSWKCHTALRDMSATYPKHHGRVTDIRAAVTEMAIGTRRTSLVDIRNGHVTARGSIRT